MEFALEISCETCWGFGRLKIAFCDKVSFILNQAISQLLLVSILLLFAHTLPEGFHHKICALLFMSLLHFTTLLLTSPRRIFRSFCLPPRRSLARSPSREENCEIIVIIPLLVRAFFRCGKSLVGMLCCHSFMMLVFGIAFTSAPASFHISEALSGSGGC